MWLIQDSFRYQHPNGLKVINSAHWGVFKEFVFHNFDYASFPEFFATPIEIFEYKRQNPNTSNPELIKLEGAIKGLARL